MGKGLLESKWAVADSPLDTSSTSTNATPKSTPSKSYISKNTPSPISSSKVEKHNSPSHAKLESRWANEDAPKHPNKHSTQSHSPETPKSRRNRKPKAHLTTPPSAKDKWETESEDSDDEPKVPMSDAAKTLASRLGGFGGSGGSPSSGSSHGAKVSTKRATATLDVRPSPARGKPARHFTPKHEVSASDSDDEKPKPMSAAGQSLAARLGMSVPSAPATSSKPKSKYTTPKQRQALQQQQKKKEQEEEEAKKAALKNEQYRAELDKLVKEMEDSHMSWADIED